MLSDEIKALKQVNEIAQKYGYGNLISYLRHLWAKELMQYNLTLTYYDAAKLTDVDAYPEDYSNELQG